MHCAIPTDQPKKILLFDKGCKCSNLVENTDGGGFVSSDFVSCKINIIENNVCWKFNFIFLQHNNGNKSTVAFYYVLTYVTKVSYSIILFLLG